MNSLAPGFKKVCFGVFSRSREALFMEFLGTIWVLCPFLGAFPPLPSEKFLRKPIAIQHYELQGYRRFRSFEPTGTPGYLGLWHF